MRKYRLVSRKGEGTSAEVIKAQNIKTGTLHAVKCMKQSYKNADQVSRLREIQAIKRLSPHQNVVKLEEILYDPPSGRLALVFELMEGNLYELMKDRSDNELFSKETVKSFMRQIFTALDHMHSKGVFHRHIKPENILVDKSGKHLKLAGFGSCRRIKGTPPFTEDVSTRWYCPPECLLTCGMYGPEMDVWGAGCILFELTTLYPLFPGTNEADQIARIHRVLGTPKEAVIAKLNMHASAHANFHFSRQEGIGLKKLLPGAESNCLDLLTRTLYYDKSDRITSKKAMEHSYFVGDIKRWTDTGKYKRRKTLPFTSTLSAGINDLSVEICCIIADFLPKTSRALLAVALTAPPVSFREGGWIGELNAVSKAIISCTKADLPVSSLLDDLCEEARVEAEAKGKKRAPFFRERLKDQMKEYYCKDDDNGNNWSALDFVDLPKSLAMRLSDDDLSAILVCIDAKNELEQLTLTHCTNIVGHGLEPLRSSTRLQALNLGLVRRFEKPFLRNLTDGRRDELAFVLDDTKLSEGPVCDIIDSVLRDEEHSFDRLQYPYKWVDNSSEPHRSVPIFHSDVLRSERMKQFVDKHSGDAILNKFSCCVYFDYDNKDGLCSYLRGDRSDLVDSCISCNEDSSFAVCSECNDIVCSDCCESYECEGCKIIHCPRCKRDNDLDEVEWCEAAGYGSDCPPQCSSCRLTGCKNGSNSCSECRSEVFGELLNECNTKQVQIDSQNDELERLRSVIEVLTIQANRSS